MSEVRPCFLFFSPSFSFLCSHSYPSDPRLLYTPITTIKSTKRHDGYVWTFGGSDRIRFTGADTRGGFPDAAAERPKDETKRDVEVSSVEEVGSSLAMQSNKSNPSVFRVLIPSSPLLLPQRANRARCRCWRVGRVPLSQKKPKSSSVFVTTTRD